MNDFISGQRWMSETESELGLGIVVDASFNRVTVLYLATGEKRVYARDNAPLTRVIFSVGDTIESVDKHKIIITALQEHQGLISYVGIDEQGQTVQMDEMELNHHILFNKPQDRLFSGQFDPSSWFQLRYETWRHVQDHHMSLVKGLQGARASLIPHQIYIAHEAANRYSPRVMLADEVGLGKTIEAGLILHYRLNNALSHRVLIIVPESLLHQWLVEMLRRFNLRMSIFDEERCLETHTANPFTTEQLILCSQDFFSHNPQRQKQAIEAGWDMVIVDEAHHLKWSEDAPSSDYLFVEQLAYSSPGLILLTATPEQLGEESHFARLRLLDPDRFYSFQAFLEEEKQFAPVAEAAKLLLASEPLTAEDKANLTHLMKDDNAEALIQALDDANASAREELVQILLDHHGTGRILFRNSRHTVKGFPEREVHNYPLQGEAAENWPEDPRFKWLCAKIKELKDQKALLICKLADTAVQLKQALEFKAGIAAAVFHENMSIVERDRAAAYFADEESAARLLVCSEIGSEGRNFQFVHHLILFDLPVNPDLLQQRIGRLDRIGQKHVIQIHVPYLEGSQEQILHHWYDQGFNAFRMNCSAASRVAELVGDELLEILENPNSEDVQRLLEKTRLLTEQIELELHNGRDLLLELNSCRNEQAQELIAQLNALEEKDDLWPYMESVFDCYGVDSEFHSNDCQILMPSEHLRMAHFPELVEDGMTVTTNRSIALAREDMLFLTWENPMVTAAMEMILASETGNATVSVIKHPDLSAGQFLIEVIFVVECSAPPELLIGRFLPPTPIRVLIDQRQTVLTEQISHESLMDTGKNFDKQQIVGFLNKQRKLLAALLNQAEKVAKTQLQELIKSRSEVMLVTVNAEIKRLVRLQKINPAIKKEEVEYLQSTAALLHDRIQEAQVRLDAVRFLITS